MSQTQQLHEWLKQKPIDPLTAWKKLGIYRLSARVNDLRNSGIQIKTRQKKINKTTKVAEYYL